MIFITLTVFFLQKVGHLQQTVMHKALSFHVFVTKPVLQASHTISTCSPLPSWYTGSFLRGAEETSSSHRDNATGVAPPCTRAVPHLDHGGTKTWSLDFPDSFTLFVYVFVHNLMFYLFRSRSPTISSSFWETGPNYAIQWSDLCQWLKKVDLVCLSELLQTQVLSPSIKTCIKGKDGINKETVKCNEKNIRCNEKYNEC